jgi:P-type conjugative transfer protein TrbJ
VNAVEADGVTLDRLIAVSQGAAGSLQAQQAGNQLVALSAKQQLQTQQLLAAQYRAEALERARQVAAEEAARARFGRFIGDGRAYTRRQ